MRLRTKDPPAVLAVMCGVSVEYLGDRHVTGTWLVLLRQSTVRCLSVDSVHIQCGGDVSISLVLIVHRSGSSEGLHM